MKKLFAVITLFAHTSAYGQLCPKAVQYLQEDQAAPCAGYLFSPEKEKEVRGLNEENKLLVKEVEIKDKILNLKEQQIQNYELALQKEGERAELWRQTSYKLAEDNLVKMQNTSTQNLLWLLSGVGLTVLSGWAIHLAAEN